VLTFVVRTAREPSEITHAIRTELDRLDRDIPLQDIFTMPQLVSSNIAQRRLSMMLLGSFAVGALLLSALGLYGVVAYIVTQRTREIGIRMALGAQQSDVLGLVIAQGMRLATLGICFGLVGALLFTRVLERLLFEIKPTDPLTFATVTAFLAGVALVACWLPARRAANVDPMVALRDG
jgi:ABC-type antimicrobial peptide transport system permease subunit